VFFGPNGFESKRDRARREAAAKAICARCPVIVACRDYAMRANEAFGVWGGLGEAERRILMQRQHTRHRTAV
jgi:WhiB family transcriptional regulator, redox-sensing transcriptional regulator